jgi:hypothetical protein
VAACAPAEWLLGGASHRRLDNNGYPQYQLNYAACNDDAASGTPSMLDVYREILSLANATREQDASRGLQQILISNGDSASAWHTSNVAASPTPSVPRTMYHLGC